MQMSAAISSDVRTISAAESSVCSTSARAAASANEPPEPTSPAAMAKIDRVWRGEEPDIRSSESFARLGIGKGDTVDYLGFGRVHASLGGFANLLGAAGFGLSMLPKERDTRPLLKMGAILSKLAPFFRELDMSFDWGTEIVTTTAPDTIMSRTIYRYH